MSWSQVANTYQEGLDNFLNMALGITQQKQQARQNTLDEAISRILNNEYYNPNAKQGAIGKFLEDYFGIETKNTKAARLNEQLANIDREKYGTDFTEFLGEAQYKTKAAQRMDDLQQHRNIVAQTGKVKFEPVRKGISNIALNPSNKNVAPGPKKIAPINAHQDTMKQLQASQYQAIAPTVPPVTTNELEFLKLLQDGKYTFK